MVGMLIVLLAVESQDRTLDVSASTSDSDEAACLAARRRENARLNELRSYIDTHHHAPALSRLATEFRRKKHSLPLQTYVACSCDHPACCYSCSLKLTLPPGRPMSSRSLFKFKITRFEKLFS